MIYMVERKIERHFWLSLFGHAANLVEMDGTWTQVSLGPQILNAQKRVNLAGADSC